MVSKKKSKGKARKAAKALREQAEHQRGAVCYHGYWKEERYVTEFVKAFLVEYNDADKWGRDLHTALKGASKSTYEKNEKYAEVWEDVEKLEVVISCFLFAATRHVLNGIIPQASVNVCIANYLEQHIIACVFRKSQSAIAGHKIAERMDADIHTLVSYLRRRIPARAWIKNTKR